MEQGLHRLFAYLEALIQSCICVASANEPGGLILISGHITNDHTRFGVAGILFSKEVEVSNSWGHCHSKQRYVGITEQDLTFEIEAKVFVGIELN